MRGIGRRLGSALALAAGAAACGVLVPPASAQIVTDGTVGPARTLGGSNVVIGADLGTLKGGNLFHSFTTFNVATGGSATFTGPAGIDNVLARVTGGGPSTIDGKLASTVPGANLFLFNPAGVAFGANASLDVPGAFHASTADTLHLSDGGRFDARAPGNSVLTSAPPSAFGFAANPAALTSGGATLAVKEGKALSLSGGPITISGGGVAAPGGTLTLTALGGPGTVSLADGSTAAPGAAVTVTNKATVASSGTGGGAVRITGGSLLVEGDSAVAADNAGAGDATGGVTVATSGAVSLRTGGKITANTAGKGRGGTIAVRAGSVTVQGDGKSSNTAIAARSLKGALGDGGRVIIRAKTLVVRYSGQISTSSLGAANGGSIDVQADSTLISHDSGQPSFGTGLFSLAASGGSAGAITITGGVLDIEGGGQVNTRTTGGAGGGTVTITVDTLRVVGVYLHNETGRWVGDPSIITSLTSGTGDAGSIQVTAKDVRIAEGGRIQNGTRASGDGGTIGITADRMVLEQGGDAIFTQGTGVNGIGVTGISTSSTETASGHGGTIHVTAGSLDIRSGAQITTSTANTGSAGTVTVNAGTLRIDGGGAGSFTGITSGSDSTAAGGGTGGAVTVRATTVSLSNRGAIAASSSGGGDAGNVSITATDRFESHGGTVATATTRSDGGNIAITAGTLVHLSDAQVTTSVAGGAGNGGNITIDPTFVVLRNGTISANAWGGNGGNIRISAGNLIATPDSRIEASSQRGVSGTVTVQAPGSQVGGNLAPLKAEFVDPSSLLRASCAARAAGAASSTLLGTGRGGVPASPDGLLLADTGPAGTRGITVACVP